MSISVGRVIKGVVSVLLMLVVCVAALARMTVISQWESNYARLPSVSSEEASRNGTLLRRLPRAKQHLRVGENDSVLITDAWIEQRSALRYRYYLWQVREKQEGTVLVFAPDSGPPVLWPRDMGISIADSTVGQRRVRDRTPDAFFIDIEAPFPDSLRFVECWLAPSRGDSVNIPARYQWLSRCPAYKATN